MKTTKFNTLIPMTFFFIFLIYVTFFHNLSYQPWIYLSVLTSSLLPFIFFKKDILIPSNKVFYCLGGLFFLLILVDLLNGSHLTEERWLMRYTVYLFAFVCMQIFENEESIFKIAGLPIVLFLLFITLESISEYIIYFDFASQKQHSVHVSRFWNIAHYCQAMVASIPIIILFKKYCGATYGLLIDFLMITLTISILLGISRSCTIALVIIYLIEFISPLVYSKKKIAGLLLVSFLIFYVLNEYKQGYSSSIQTQKEHSLNYRKAIWKKSIELSLDNPAGVGVNNFGFSLFGYLDNEKLSDQLTDINVSPHNEFLRILAEEGWGFFILYLIGFIFISYNGFIKIFIKKESAIFYRFFFCMMPEMLFQFPTEMYMPCFLFGLLCFTSFEKKSKVKRNKILLLTSAIILSIFSTASWVIRNEKIIPLNYSKTMCSIYHDDWRLCRRYFIDYLGLNKPQDASDVIRPIIKYQPFNFNNLTLDHMLGDTGRRQFISCLYINLFNGQIILGQETELQCEIEKDRAKLRNVFFEYAEQR